MVEDWDWPPATVEASAIDRPNSAGGTVSLSLSLFLRR
jgi:hypothetical protein